MSGRTTLWKLGGSLYTTILAVTPDNSTSVVKWGNITAHLRLRFCANCKASMKAMTENIPDILAKRRKSWEEHLTTPGLLEDKADATSRSSSGTTFCASKEFADIFR